jgi:hypothetical protein
MPIKKNTSNNDGINIKKDIKSLSLSSNSPISSSNSPISSSNSPISSSNSPISSSKNKIKPFINKQKSLTRICQEWHQNKLNNPLNPINPYTEYTVKKNGPKYRELEKLCKTVKININNNDNLKIYKKKTVLTEPLTAELCEKWMKDKFRNPITNYQIGIKAAIYKELAAECPAILANKKKSDVIIKPDIKKPNIKKPEIIKPEIKIKVEDVNYNKDRFNEDTVYYPSIEDPDFADKLMSLKEINVHTINKYDDIMNIDDFEKKANELCKGFDKSFFQYLMGHYLSYRMPYKSILIYYSVGVGKTCTAITIAETFLISHNTYEEPKIWVIMPQAVEDGFKQQIFKRSDYKTISNQCTGDLYVKLAQITENMSDIEVDKRIKKLIKSRYHIFTYEGFATFYENNYTSKGIVASDKIIIVDEAHNIRQGNSEEVKRVYSTLTDIAKTGINNKLILLSATPMYNQPSDIFDLLELLLLNDKRTDYKIPKNIFDENNELYEDAKKFLISTSSIYISYLRGKNPFNFAFKLSPKLSNIPVLDKTIPLTESGNPIENVDNNWIDKVSDGIVISKLGEKQLKYLSDKKIVDVNIQNNFKGLQPMNIVYENNIGSKGFYTIFRRNDDINNDSYNISYNPNFKNALMPDEKHLGLYSGKILNILNIIAKTKGITIIYSKYLHSGIIPVAIALEHFGYSRYGTDNILQNPTIASNAPKYDGIKNPKYCILTSDNNNKIMGGTTISKLINIINNPNNINGEQIKVILMSPVAGEGLNIFNVREIHLLEAWYHFNRIDQIIGRGIRNCSHKNLPIEYRNVTVFMHCAIENYKKETADVHAYRISSRKLYQSFIVDDIIRSNSIDCRLFKNINYFPKSMFKLGKINISTSQNVDIDYELGDDPVYEPKCSMKPYNPDNRGFRQDTYKHLSLNTQMKIRNILLDYIHNEIYFINYLDINKFFPNIDNDILMYAISLSIYPNIIIDGYIIIPHEDGLHIVKVMNDIPLKIALVKNDIDVVENKLSDTDIKLYKEFEKIKEKPLNNAIISLYSSMDSISFNFIIKKILSSSNHLSEIDNFIANCLYREGVLIAGKELPQIGLTDKYIGFVNIFNDDFDPLLYNNGNYKELTPKQLEILKSNRKHIVIPDMKREKLQWGLFVPIFTDKEKKNKRNAFKLLTPGEAYGKKTGIVCTSLHKPQHRQIINDLNMSDGKFTKDNYCHNIATELYKINRISLNPEWKPLITNI